MALWDDRCSVTNDLGVAGGFGIGVVINGVKLVCSTAVLGFHHC